MISNEAMSVIFLFIFLIGLGFEIIGISTNKKGDTISENIWSWRNRKHTTARRIMLAIGFGWLFYHFVFDGF